MSESHTLGQASSTGPSGSDYECLSPRQKQVCDLIVDGLTSKAIAERLGTTVHTITAHRAEVMRKLQPDLKIIDSDAFTDTVQRIHDQKTAVYETLVSGGSVVPI